LLRSKFCLLRKWSILYARKSRVRHKNEHKYTTDVYESTTYIYSCLLKSNCRTFNLSLLIVFHYIVYSTILYIPLYCIFNNYSPKAKWLPVNIHRDEVEVNIHRNHWAWGE
jgi:hypothetical protein